MTKPPQTGGGFPGLMRELGKALRRGILGRSSHAYRQQFSGDDDYWDDVVSAQAAANQVPSAWPPSPPDSPPRQRAVNGPAGTNVGPDARP